MTRFIKFALIGGAATLLQFFLLWIFVEFLGLITVVASAASYCGSAIFNYLANYYFTFGSDSSHKETLPRFVLTVALGMTFSTVLFSIFQHTLINFAPANTILYNRAYLIAQLFATLLTLIVNFLMHKFWIYRR